MIWRKLSKFLKNRGCYRAIKCIRDGHCGLYMERFYLIRTPYFEVMLHRFHKGDDRVLHDHPWRSISVILEGGYREWVLDNQGNQISKIRKPGYFGTRAAEDFHRVELLEDYGKDTQVWTLFIAFRRKRTWGFLSDTGEWVHHLEYTSNHPGLEEGRPVYKGYILPRVSYKK